MNMRVVGAMWVQELRNFFSLSWWARFLFFTWRRLARIWRSPYFLLTVIWLQIICLWGGVAPSRVGCFCFDPSMIGVMRLALGLVQVWYVYLVVMLARVSLYPATAESFRRIEQERGLAWLLQLLVPCILLIFLLDIPAVWPFVCLWALVAADSNFLGIGFFWRLSSCAIYWVVFHAPVIALLVAVAYWAAYFFGSALVLHFAIFPSFFAAMSVVYTQGLAQA
ncbi:TPA: hypothetical protein DCW54_02475 [Candidatus Dependentiae bacterium]|nr:hypothetical protein [Candidatus Dependentiae bacterium]